MAQRLHDLVFDVLQAMEEEVIHVLNFFAKEAHRRLLPRKALYAPERRAQTQVEDPVLQGSSPVTKCVFNLLGPPVPHRSLSRSVMSDMHRRSGNSHYGQAFSEC